MNDESFDFAIDRSSGKTLTRQVEEGVRALVASGLYAPGSTLPPRGEIAKRYQQDRDMASELRLTQ